MPFARVGAMPQPSSTKQRNGQRKGGSNHSPRQKGITMEDLKKQTALRLAQEQQQKQGGYYVDPNRERPLQPLAEQQFVPYGQCVHPAVALNPVVNPGYPTGHVGIPAPNVGFPNQGYPIQNPPVAQFSPTGSYDSYGNPLGVASFVCTENRQLSPRNLQQHVLMRREDVDPPQNYQYPPLECPPHVGAQHLVGGVASVGSHRASGSGKQKLPHGLTVHELKEMTKARLQAEAADKPDTERQLEIPVDSRRVSPLDFDSVPEVRESAASRDSGFNNNSAFLHHGPGSTSSIPSMVQVGQQPRELSFGRQPQVSPIPTVFQNSSSSLGGSAFNQPKADGWDSISVASHNSTAASENYGSESVYSGGPSSAYGPPSESEFQYSHSNGLPGHYGTSSAHASPSLFDPAIGGNRRRATTLSPRALSIHEDRPIVHGDELRMPNFTSSSRGTLSSRPSRNYSPVLGLDDTFLGESAGLAPLGGTDLNRPRTSSATSLPLSSHGALDFNRDRANTFSGFSAGQTRGDGLMDSVSNALTENFLRGSRNDVDNIAAPPGFALNTGPLRPRAATEFTGVTQRGSYHNGIDPWGRSQGDNGSSLFASEGIDDLTTSMGSILKLSGLGSDRPDRERSNTYPYGAFR